mgnify:CR=1 FL=1
MIPLCRPVFTGREREYVDECLRTGWVVTGEFIDRFEDALSKRFYYGAPVVTVNSGTTALSLALKAHDVVGQLITIPMLTFKATMNAVWAARATVNLRDVDLPSWVLIGFFGGTVIPVDLNGVGSPATGAVTIHDAAGALGGTTHSHTMILSFNANKLITTGGGGAVVCPSKSFADRIRLMSRHVRDGEETRGDANLMLTNLQAAIGLGQMEQFDEKLAAKKRIAERYTAELGPSFIPQAVPPGMTTNHWLYSVRCQDADHRQRVEQAMAAANIEVRRMWKPLGYGPNAEAIYSTALSLPCSVDLNERDQETVIRCARTA